MIHDPEIETRAPAHQFRIDAAQYTRQIEYLFGHSAFYRHKLQQAGFRNATAVGTLSDIQQLPFTTKDELRQTQAEHPPFGAHLACDPAGLERVYSTSGTTGVPCFIGLTRHDIDMVATNVARGYTAAGFTPGQRVVISANAGPFVAGAVYTGIDRIGCTTIPVGTGNTERMVASLRALHATGIACTPSFGLYLADWCHERGIEPRDLQLRNMITAGEPGGGDALIRARLEQTFGCHVRECMGIGDISLTVWGDDADGNGMHFMARGSVHVELIDPDSGQALTWEDGAQGELVYTALRREAMPLLRFRSRDHVRVILQPNPTGRTGPRIRCIGRTDDMLIVRGVNLFPSALRGVLQDFAPEVGEQFQIRPKVRGVMQAPPLPVVLELARGMTREPDGLRQRLHAAIRARLLVSVEVELVPHGTLPRGEYKSKLVQVTE